MYRDKDKSAGIIAVIYYAVYLLGLFAAGILYRGGITYGMNIIYCLMFAIGVLIVLIKDKSVRCLGFGTEKLKSNLIISFAIVAAAFAVVAIFAGKPLSGVLLNLMYYLFYIAAVEEILFRGFIQNYLFGFKLNKYLTFIIGGLLFSFMHIPFQMFVHNNVSLSYLIEAIPNLIETFIFHLLFCWIACKRKDIYIPIAIHCAYDFLGMLF